MAVTGFVKNAVSSIKNKISSDHFGIKSVKNLFNENKENGDVPTINTEIFGTDLPFDTAESYKLLRANLSFALPQEEGCQVIAVTSSIRGEGKSTVAINLSYTMAQAGKKTLLIDSDMRLPSIAKKLHIRQKPGLSNVIVGLESAESSIINSDKIPNVDILPAGNIPPNPSELISSKGMISLMEKLRSKYDTIIIDLPPVTIVSDAMVISNVVDGFIIVVRQDYSDKSALNKCMSQVEVIKPKILGFVMSASTSTEKGYYYRRRRHYYGNYYKHHHHYYGYERRYGYYKRYSYYGSKKYGYGYGGEGSRNNEFLEAAKSAVQSEDNKGQN